MVKSHVHVDDQVEKRTGIGGGGGKEVGKMSKPFALSSTHLLKAEGSS